MTAMADHLHTDPLAFREAQVANARGALRQVDLDGLDGAARAAVEQALRALNAPSPDRTMAPSADVGIRAQEAAEAHLAACYEAEFAFEEGNETVESPASAPFCSCETCVVREVLYAAWPVFEAEAWLAHIAATTADSA